MQKKILVVEDNPINRTVLKEILSDEYAVLEADNGQEALDVLTEKKDEISLILLDIIMPVMDGYTFLTKMKENPELSVIPVIVTTQSDSEEDEVTALAYGATDFIAKPYRPKIILHTVASIINLRETAAMINHFQYDSLTGLYTKDFFYQKVQKILQQYPEKNYDIICSNVENFKFFNDIFGVARGDQLLIELGELHTRLSKNHGICCRYNADRFVSLMERSQSYDNELFQQCEESIDVKNVAIKWGIYEIMDRQMPVEQMCDRAILAADSIKGRYGKHFTYYDEELRNKRLRENAIAESMEVALEEGQFLVYLQPKYSLKDDSMTGAEALVRWIHPVEGFLSPGEFIPLFEKNGFITRLDEYIWERVCQMQRNWEDRGFPIVPISVNVSRADIYQTDLPAFLLRLVRKYSLDPSCLHLEITESAYTDDPEQIIQTVLQLRELGFIIEMDDFGSGYSSLNMLNQMDLDILKLDMKFIQSETAKPVKERILQFVIDLARWMELRVVGEGVETREQLEYLREIGCDYVQGFLLAKPMPHGDFEKLLAEADNCCREEDT